MVIIQIDTLFHVTLLYCTAHVSHRDLLNIYLDNPHGSLFFSSFFLWIVFPFFSSFKIHPQHIAVDCLMGDNERQLNRKE